jgi:hypothetical protein
MVDNNGAINMQANAPTQQDIQFSIDSINNALAQLDEVQQKPNWQAKKYEASFTWARKHMAMGIKLHITLPEINAVKRDLDNAMKANDAAAFETALNAFNTLMYKLDLTQMRKDSKRKLSTYFKCTAPYQRKLINMLDWLADTRDGGAEWLKRAKMTDKERATADKRSAAMQMRWAGF